MKKLLFFFFLISHSLLAQDINRYMVYFSDKAGSSYSLERPEEFLTARALERRARQQIVLQEQDLPVNEQYIQQVEAQDVAVYYRSRWLNAVMVEDTEEKVKALAAMPFVQTVTFVAPGPKLNGRRGSQLQNPLSVPQTQHELLEISKMHELGFTGTSVLIAVLDDGFLGVNTSDKFDHLFRNQQILHQWDFVGNAADVFRYDDHGTKSLSTIAVIDSGTFIGVAPEANFLLAVTEDYLTEYVVEEYNWLIASEWADSLGADIITSSLGYATFDDPGMNHTKSDMDGRSTIAARAASWASERGILVVSSSGNSRNKPWNIISTPADADNIISVGAINAEGSLASFSSGGPTADGRIKPEVVAQGVSTVVVGASGNYQMNNGTSFAAPQIAGLAAGVWQAFPLLTNLELRDVILRASDRYTTPDNDYGYGLPRSSKLFSTVTKVQDIVVYPNPVYGAQPVLHVSSKISSLNPLQVQIIDPTGRIIGEEFLRPLSSGRYELQVDQLPAGLYYLYIVYEKGVSKHKFLRL